jgi:hypothetical protein
MFAGLPNAVRARAAIPMTAPVITTQMLIFFPISFLPFMDDLHTA